MRVTLSEVRSLGLVGTLLATMIVAPSLAAAQSRRYPPEPVDRDKDAADRSKLWDNATNPRTRPYEDLVAEARRALGERTEDHARVAIDKLGRAIELLPEEPEAYALRGAAHMELQAWASCADDLAVAAQRSPRDDAADRKDAIELRRKLGICQARAGRLADAERTLSEAAASGTGTGEMLMRLGEVRIAMGKLDEAIGALTAALDASDLPSKAVTRWLLASAYDRARRPAEAIEEARRAAGMDGSFGSLKSQSVPLLGAGETEYLLGLAYATAERSWPDKALVYFRKFVRVAPDSPWRRRVDDHLRELERAALPETVERKGGLAAIDTDAARAIVRKAMPAMRACMARLPSSVIEVQITRVGPRAKPGAAKPPPRPPRPTYRHRRYPYRPPAPPPAGTTVMLQLNVDSVPRAETDAAARCIEPLASRLPLPAVKETDGWYKVGFVVVSP